jgi:hypothetical protein
MENWRKRYLKGRARKVKPLIAVSGFIWVYIA